MKKRPTSAYFLKGVYFPAMPKRTAKSKRSAKSTKSSSSSKPSKGVTIRAKLEELRSKIPEITPDPLSDDSDGSIKSSGSARFIEKKQRKKKKKKKAQLPAIPFPNLGQWLVQLVHAVFHDRHDEIRQLVHSLRERAKQCQSEQNEHAHLLDTKLAVQSALPPHLYKMIDRMHTVFMFKEAAHVRGIHSITQYLTLMVERAQTVSSELVRQEKNAETILDQWTQTLENDRDVLVTRIKHCADCEPVESAALPLFNVTQLAATPAQLDELLEYGKELFDIIQELRQHRVTAITNGDKQLVQEIERHLRGALSKAHAITGARQYFYTARDEPDLLRFTTNTQRLKHDLTALLALPRLYHNDYEMAARQLQSTIDENIGGMRLFATLKLRQEFLRAAHELEEEMCRQIHVLFQTMQSEIKLLNDELDLLHTNFLAEFARARLDEELWKQATQYIKALHVAFACATAQRDQQFLALVAPNHSRRRTARVTTPRSPAPLDVEKLAGLEKADLRQTTPGTDLSEESDAASETSSRSGDSVSDSD